MKRLPWILLAISVAFNIFVAVGYVRWQSSLKNAATFKSRCNLMADKLGLTDEQKARFQAIQDQMEQIRQAHASGRDGFWNELLKDKPDPNTLREYVAGEAAVKYRLDRLELMQKFVQLLTPAQKEQFRQLVVKQDSSPQ